MDRTDMRALVACMLLLAAGCGKKEPAATPKACEDAIAHLDWPEPLKLALAKSCVDTKWSAAVLACVKDAPDLNSCKEKMTVDQRSFFVQIALEMEKSEAARKEKEKAEELAEQAVKDAKEAQAAVEQLEQQATDLQKRITEATDAVVGAANATDIKAGQEKLSALQRERVELDARIAEAKAKAARAERLKGVKISKECLDNPLAKGCN